MGEIKLLDCTLRDGAYIVDAKFGKQTIGGIIKRLQNANVEIIECGWLKDEEHSPGTSFFHVPSDLEQYLLEPKSKFATYVAMIDYNRYDLSFLPEYDGKSIDAIRVVFPRDKVDEGLALVELIRKKGYKVYLQAANTFGYSDRELIELAEKVNEKDVVSLSIVDTFGAMYERDLVHIMSILNKNLDKRIGIGFHSHNNHQLSFALSMKFVDEMMASSERNCIIDASLVGMGRGAGNTPTEMISNYLNRTHNKNYDENVIIELIDVYMTQFVDNYKWGYSIPYMLAGNYECHVNNIKYLTQTHRATGHDMKIMFEMLDPEDRVQYDYDNLEKIYMDYQSKKINDEEEMTYLREQFGDKTVVAVAPGKNAVTYKCKVDQIVTGKGYMIVGINSLVAGYDYDWLFFSNTVKYNMAMDWSDNEINSICTILTSNVETGKQGKIFRVNYDNLVKRNWQYYDNSMIMFLRLMSIVCPKEILLVGFDGFMEDSAEKYANEILENHLPKAEVTRLHKDTEEMFRDFLKKNRKKIRLSFLTPSVYESQLMED